MEKPMLTSQFVAVVYTVSCGMAALLFTGIIYIAIQAIIYRYAYEYREGLYNISAMVVFGGLLSVYILYGERTYRFLAGCGQVPF